MNRVCKIWAVLAAAGFLLVSGGCGGNTAISPVRESTAPVPEEAAAGITAAAFVNERNAADSGVEEPSSDSGDTADMGEENTPISLVVELDPGHGGVQSGAERAQDGILEKELNLKIAEYLKKENLIPCSDVYSLSIVNVIDPHEERKYLKYIFVTVK